MRKAPVKTGARQGVGVPYGKGIANHLSPESCASRPQGVREALTRGYAGRDIEPRKDTVGVPTPSYRAEGNMGQGRYRKSPGRPRVVEDPAHACKSREQEPGYPATWPWISIMAPGSAP